MLRSKYIFIGNILQKAFIMFGTMLCIDVFNLAVSEEEIS